MPSANNDGDKTARYALTGIFGFLGFKLLIALIPLVIVLLLVACKLVFWWMVLNNKK